MELTREEESALKGEHGEIMQMAYRILAATGEAVDAERLVPIEWAHLSGVNYNTIGDAGEEFLSSISKNARVKVKTTLNPMGFDVDNVENYNLDKNFISKQLSIKKSYETMGVTPSFSCIPYEIFEIPKEGTQVAFAESNAAIHANSYDNLKTNKESAFSALASAITGKSPYSSLRKDDSPNITIRMKVKNPNELTYGMLGFFAGKVGDTSVNISGLGKCMVDVIDELNTNISGSGTVTYKTLPKKLNENNTGLGNTKSYSEDNSSENMISDTTKITIGKDQVWIIGKKDYTFLRNQKLKPIWGGFEMGINSYVNSNGSFTLSPGLENFE